MRIGPKKQHINNFEKITYTVHCKKLTYFSRLGMVAESPNAALPDNLAVHQIKQSVYQFTKEIHNQCCFGCLWSEGGVAKMIT